MKLNLKKKRDFLKFHSKVFDVKFYKTYFIVNSKKNIIKRHQH